MKKILVTVLFGAAVAALAVYALRGRTQTNAAIATLKDWAKGTDEQRRAIQLLESKDDPETLHELLGILSAPGTRPDVRILIVQLLSKRNSPEAELALSELMQPHNAPNLRHEVGMALHGHRCEPACAQNLLHFLERSWPGQSSDELPTQQGSRSGDTLEQVESETIAEVADILVSNRDTTALQLRKVYGLGSLHPSRFAIQTASLLGLREACSDLAKSYLLEVSNEETKALIRKARQQLACDSKTDPIQ